MPTPPQTCPTQVIFDFDGTCTRIPQAQEKYLELYRQGLDNELTDGVTEAQWLDVQQALRSASPRAGWTVAGCEAAPAGADPYILANEAAAHLCRRRGVTVPPDLHALPYADSEALWRSDARATIATLLDREVNVAFVSNSSTKTIKDRVIELFKDSPAYAERVEVVGDAGKFCVSELPWDDASLSKDARERFASLPAAVDTPSETGRPVYLRRGRYLSAIDRILGGEWDRLPSTLFCGDVWEMDLAMPAALGGLVHLLDRAAPFETYAYERQALAAVGDRGRASVELSGLLDWFERPPRVIAAATIRGGNSSIYVADMDRAVRFYTDAVGLRLRLRIGNEWAELDAGDGMIIGLHLPGLSTIVKPGSPGAINIELRVTGEIEGVVEQLKRRGVVFVTTIENYKNVRLAKFHDPDGNCIVLAQTIG